MTMNEQMPHMRNVSENDEMSFAEYFFNDEKTLASFCHLSFLGGFVIPLVGNFLGLLLIGIFKKGIFPFVDRNLKEAMNFQVTMALTSLLAMALAFYSLAAVYVAWALSVFSFCCSLYAAFMTFQGQDFRYPVNLRIWRPKPSEQ